MGDHLLAVAHLAWRMFLPSPEGRAAEPELRRAVMLAVPISVLAGLLGVGPGFLLMPALVLVGYEPKMAVGINAVAVTLPSFTSLVPHLPSVDVDLRLAAVRTVVSTPAATRRRPLWRRPRGRSRAGPARPARSDSAPRSLGARP